MWSKKTSVILTIELTEVTVVWTIFYDAEDVLSKSYDTLKIALKVQEEILSLDIMTPISD